MAREENKKRGGGEKDDVRKKEKCDCVRPGPMAFPYATNTTTHIHTHARTEQLRGHVGVQVDVSEEGQGRAGVARDGDDVPAPGPDAARGVYELGGLAAVAHADQHVAVRDRPQVAVDLYTAKQTMPPN